MTGGHMRRKILDRAGRPSGPSMTVREALRAGQDVLEQAGIEEAAVDAWLLMEYASGLTRARYYMEPDRLLSGQEADRYAEAVEKRAERIPLQHITGEQEFMGHCFRVNRHVLIPRQDTEVLVECALAELPGKRRILDLCTGSGCIIISLFLGAREKGMPAGQSVFTGVDISEEALCVAEENGRLLGADVNFLKSDLFESVEGRFDLIVSNPPYIRTDVIAGLQEEVKLHDPWIALDGREDGLYFYREIIRQAKTYLSDGGWLMFEIGHDQRAAVERLMEEEGYAGISSKKDLAGLDRVVMGRYNKK